MRILWMLSVCVAGSWSFSAAAQEVDKKDTSDKPIEARMLERNNTLRTRLGRLPQRLSERLTQAAQNQAEYMARTGQYSHYVNSGPGGRLRRFGYLGRLRGEIIHCTPTTVEKAFDGWMKSPPHRSILLGSATEAGFGYAVSKGGTAYWVGVYGTPTPPEEPKAEATPAKKTSPKVQSVSHSHRRRGLRRRR